MKEKYLLIASTFIFFLFSVKTQLVDDSVYLSSLNNYTNPLDKVRKEIIDAALQSLPKREAIDELKMALEMKKAKQKYSLNDAESAYLIYKWLLNNIFFNSKYEKRETETTTYNTGRGSYYGISHIFLTMCTFLGLKAKYIEGYTITSHYVNDEKIVTKRDYGWNSVIIDNKYYLVDAIGEGYYDYFLGFYSYGDDNYFCPFPEYFIRSHFPLDNKWQLLTQKKDLESFLSGVTLYYPFFQYGFKSITPDKSFINVNNKLKIVLTNEKPDKILRYDFSCDYCEKKYYLFSNVKERTEIELFFNKKRHYLFKTSTISNNKKSQIVEYVIANEIEKHPPLNFPQQFYLSNGIKLIKPLYSPLKRGETINFKILFESSDKLIIKDEVGNITLTKEGNIFTGQYFINDRENNTVDIQYLDKNGNYETIFRYDTN